MLLAWHSEINNALPSVSPRMPVLLFLEVESADVIKTLEWKS